MQAKRKSKTWHLEFDDIKLKSTKNIFLPSSRDYQRVPHPYKNSLIFDFFPFMTIIELPFIPACKRMAIDTNAPKLGLQYSTSNDFFPETIEFLQKLGFISVLSIDMDIKYSFQKTNRSTIIQGAEADIYDNDHAVSDTFFIYKITIPRETRITRSLISIKLNQKKSITLKEVFGFIKSFPMVSLLIFMILSLMIPGKIWKIIQIVNAITLLIFILFFAYKFIRYFFDLTKRDSKSMQDHMVTYLNPYDLKIFTPALKEQINKVQELGVTNIAIDRTTIYLKQSLINESDTSIFGQLFSGKPTMDEKKKEEVMTAMIDLLSNQNLLDLFKEHAD